MGNEIMQGLKWLWQEHKCTSLGLVLGGLFGISVLIFGLWSTFFVVLCGLVGLWLGHELDTKADIIYDVREFFARFLPERFHRFGSDRGHRRFDRPYDDYDDFRHYD